MSQPNATIKLNLSELNVLLKSLKNTGMIKVIYSCLLIIL